MPGRIRLLDANHGLVLSIDKLVLSSDLWGSIKLCGGGGVKNNLCSHENFMLQKQSSCYDDIVGNVLPPGGVFLLLVRQWVMNDTQLRFITAYAENLQSGQGFRYITESTTTSLFVQLMTTHKNSILQLTSSRFYFFVTHHFNFSLTTDRYTVICLQTAAATLSHWNGIRF